MALLHCRRGTCTAKKLIPRQTIACAAEPAKMEKERMALPHCRHGCESSTRQSKRGPLLANAKPTARGPRVRETPTRHGGTPLAATPYCRACITTGKLTALRLEKARQSLHTTGQAHGTAPRKSAAISVHSFSGYGAAADVAQVPVARSLPVKCRCGHKVREHNAGQPLATHLARHFLPNFCTPAQPWKRMRVGFLHGVPKTQKSKDTRVASSTPSCKARTSGNRQR